MKAIHVHRLGVWIITTVLLSTLGSFAQGFGSSSPEHRPRPGTALLESSEPEPEHSDKVLPAQFQMTVYEVQTSSDRVAALEGKALTREAGTAETLLKALASFGKTRILYRIDQPVNVYSEQITIGGSEPMITATRLGPNGHPINSITYQNVGVIVRLSAQLPAQETNPSKANVKLAVRLALLVPSDTETAPGQKAMATRTVSVEHSEALELDRPLVMISVSSASGVEPSTPTAYVIRYMFSPPVGK